MTRPGTLVTTAETQGTGRTSAPKNPPVTANIVSINPVQNHFIIPAGHSPAFLTHLPDTHTASAHLNRTLNGTYV